MIKTTNDGNVFVAVPVNYQYGGLSVTGKSFVYRVKGTYLDSKGNIKGSEEKFSPYLRITLPFTCKEAGEPMRISNAIKNVEFDSFVSDAFKFTKYK